MSSSSSNKLVLYHIPKWRSTRAVWMFRELEELYGRREWFPALELVQMDPATFRTQKTEEFLKLNPNGKVLL